MVSHGRVELLAHPLSQKYLQMKWNSYGKYFHITNLLFYSIFLGIVTCFSSKLMQDDQHTAPMFNYVPGGGGNHRNPQSASYWIDRINKTYEVRRHLLLKALLITIYSFRNIYPTAERIF